VFAGASALGPQVAACRAGIHRPLRRCRQTTYTQGYLGGRAARRTPRCNGPVR